jgi:hypothetical protein
MKLLFIASFLMISGSLMAETVKLKNGTVLKGVIVEMNQTDLVIDTAEMGRVTVKRYTIQNISDDNAGGSSGTVINVNNSNHVEQKNQQTNSQVNNQSSRDRDDARRWHQGIQGRFLVSQESAQFKQKSEALDFPKAYTGIDWDLIGFRSESWWAIYLNAVSQSTTRNEMDYNLGGAGIRLDWNAFKSVNGDTLSLLYFGIGVGSGSITMESTDLSGRKLSYELSGTRTNLRIGYDYFWGRYWGLSAFASVNSATYSNVSFKMDGVEINDASVEDEVSVSSSSFGVGLLWNVDL